MLELLVSCKIKGSADWLVDVLLINSRRWQVLLHTLKTVR